MRLARLRRDQRVRKALDRKFEVEVADDLLSLSAPLEARRLRSIPSRLGATALAGRGDWAYHLRHKDDENLIVSFGLYKGALEDRDRIREGHGGDEQRLEQIAEHVEDTLVEGAFEVIDEVDPTAG